MKPANFVAIAFAILGALPAVVRGQDAFTLPDAKVGAAYEFSITAQGGSAPLEWRVVAGELPPGIELQPSGILRGVPTTPRPEAYQFTIEVADSSRPPQSFRQRFSFLVKTTALHMALGGNEIANQLTPKMESGPAAVTTRPSATSPVASAAGGRASSVGGAGVTAGAGVAPPNDDDDVCPQDKSDCREDFVASAYLGLAIDTFASGETRLYLNPNAPSGPKERMVGGIDFDYRLVGTPLTLTSGHSHAWPNQLWVYGETVHGVRSSDIDCSKNATFLTCQTSLAIPNRPADQILFTFRNATSLEGFAGFRYEFLSLHPGSISPANLYLKAQAGFLTVSGAPSAAKAVHHVGLGAITTKGDFQGSYLEFGFGRNDLFAQKRLSRWKVDAYLSKRITKVISLFAQITVDTDIGPGADSIQSYLGFHFDLRKLKDLLKPNP